MKAAENGISSVDDSVSAAEKLHQAGDVGGARRRLEQLIDAHPDHAPAVFALARLAAGDGRVDDCVALLKRAIALRPDEVEYHARLGAAHEHAGDTAGALDANAQILRLDPHNVPALLRSGALHVARDEPERAALAYQQVVLIRGPVGAALKRSDLPAGLRRQFMLMQSTLSAKYRDLLNETWRYLDERYRPADLQRIRLAFSAPPGQHHRRYAHPQQRPEFLMFPGLEPVAWFERERLPWVRPVEAAFETVLNEYRALREDEGGFTPYIHGDSDKAVMTPLGTDFSSLAGNRDWSAFHLNKAGRIDDNCARCPQTAALMDTLPLAQADRYMPEVFFSVLAPGAHIVPHYGQMNVRLTVHLGLVVPRDCGLRVAGEARHWVPGRLLAFDDSFHHEAWNRSDSERAVLIFEVWHPGLTEAEIDGLQHFFRTRARWLARFTSRPEVSKHG